MVDFQTQFRQYGYKYNAPTVTQPISTRRDLNRSQERHVFKTLRTQGKIKRKRGSIKIQVKSKH